MTIKEKAQILLTRAGWRRDPQPKSGKYAVYIRNGNERKFYLGTHGAIRFGRNQASSLPYSLQQLEDML